MNGGVTLQYTVFDLGDELHCVKEEQYKCHNHNITDGLTFSALTLCMMVLTYEYE